MINLKKIVLFAILFSGLLSCKNEGRNKGYMVESNAAIIKGLNPDSISSPSLSSSSPPQKARTQQSRPAMVYVTAESGLVYREQPAVDAKKLGTLEFGSLLQVLKKTGIQLDIQDEGKTVTGEWIKVRLIDHDWRDPESTPTGYVFSGFTVDSAQVDLSRLPRYFDLTGLKQLGRC
ncbi:MAG: SH3 domain-containing protein [Bacteroidota bacterium]